MKNLLIVLLCLGLVGCATFDTIRYDEMVNYTPFETNQVKVLPALPTDKEYISIGEIKCEAAPASEWDSLYKKLREKAAEMGGNAIVVYAGTSYAGTYTAPGSSQTSYNSVTSLSTGQTTYYGGQTTYFPGYSIPMYRKQAVALVIRIKE